MDRGAWQATVHGVTKSRTRLSDFTYSLKLLKAGAVFTLFTSVMLSTYHIVKGFPGGSVVKNHLPVQETWVRSLGQENLLEEMTAHSSILAWEIP